MPSKQKHVCQAAKNERFYDHFDLDHTEFLDWAVTALFYSLVHYVDAFLALHQYHPPDHKRRTNLIATEVHLKSIYCKYRQLKDQSEHGRYLIKTFTPTDVRELKNNQFESAKIHLLNLL